MTGLDTDLSGDAVDAVRVLQVELSGEYSEMRSAEVQLAEVILTAHAVTVSGRDRLRDIQRQLIEAITNPVAALDTPAGERHFLMFLRGKVAEIQQIVDAGALTDEDHAKLTRALGSGYLVAAPGGDGPAAAGANLAPAGTAQADQTAGQASGIGSALGALPQALMGAAALPLQAIGGLAGAVSPLMGLASGLTDGAGEQTDLPEDRVGDRREPEPDPADRRAEAPPDEADDPGPAPAPRPEPPQRDPAQTRPAGGR